MSCTSTMQKQTVRAAGTSTNKKKVTALNKLPTLDSVLVGMTDFPPQATALLTGQRLGGGGDTDCELHWVLALTARAVEPSAFGAAWLGQLGSCSEEAKANPGANKQAVALLCGSWDLPGRRVRLTQRGEHPVTYEGRVQRGEQGLQIQGTWRCGGASGAFALCAEPDDNASHCTGLWLGSSKPSPELEAFLIPTNPIRWALTLQRNGPCFGCGYFDDAADVPGQPVLLFLLQGSWAEEGIGQLKLAKTYEAVASGQTDGVVVDYEGRLQEREDGRWLEGSWRNDSGGSYGTWLCRCEPPWSSESYQLVLCSVCQAPIRPGELRFDCPRCAGSWSACERCAAGREAGEVHEHGLVPETMTETKRVDAGDCASLVAEALREFSPRPALGTRERGEGEFLWLTYQELGQAAELWARGLAALGLRSDENVLLAADVSPNYVAVLLSSILLRAVLVPIPAASDHKTVAYVCERTRPPIAAVGEAQLPAFAAAWPDDTPRHAVEIPPGNKLVCTPLPCNTVERRLTAAQLFGLTSTTAASALQLPPAEAGTSVSEAPRAILWTSGSTGTPKGAVFTDGLMLPVGRGATIVPFVRLDFEPYDPSFPLSLLQTLRWGGQRCIACGLDTLLEDFQLARPTHIGATPVLWNMLHREFVSRTDALLRAAPPGERDRAAAEVTVGTEMRHILGNRIHVASSGGAHTAPEVLDFVKTVLKIDIANSYGSRETGGIAVDGKIYPGVEVRLRDLPDLGYSSQSSPPQGEVLVHSPRLIPGYYADEEKSKDAFITLDGRRFYCTGDVGELRPGPDGQPRLHIIDRCAFFFKLSQGEWVSPVQVEAVLERSPFVAQALVLGFSSQPSPVAVVVPTHQFQQQGAASAEAMLRHIRLWCANEQLRTSERPCRVHLEDQEWTVAGGGLTANLKKNRPSLVARYRDICHELYERSAPGAVESQSATRGQVSDALMSMLQAALPAQLLPKVWEPQLTFAQLGGDSLAAGRLLAKLRAAGLEVSIAALFDHTLGHLSAVLEACGSGGLSTVRGVSVNWESESAWPQELPAHAQLPAQDGKAKTALLLTGATGFLGPLLLRELLAKRRGDVLCLVRGQKAYERLHVHCLRTGLDIEGEPRVQVLQGDLSLTNFGLDDERWQVLVDQVGEVVHNGAVVNHLLPYSALRPTNIDGTRHVLSLAMAAGASLTFVSSTAALPVGVQSAETWVEISGEQFGALGGYGQTKAVAERLFKQAVDRGLRVCVVRCSDVAPDRRTGYFNPKDGTLALVRACCVLRAAVLPTGYSMGWLPGDAAAEAIVTLAEQMHTCPAPNSRVYHLAGTGPALTSVLAAMRSKGYQFDRVNQQTWRGNLRVLAQNDQVLAPALPLLERINFPAANVVAVPVQTTATREALGGLTLQDWEVSAADLERYVDRWLADDFLPSISSNSA